ncbi:MAG: molybdenum cofactor guanylyltransferase MobA [Alphaproteobacteria bacterium]|nr:molybdenum cofactor guanylyltransferase MobA [Alphaproteobacteria bacterium]
MNKPLGVILAGGLSRRMGGGDKALLLLDKKTILRHVIDRLALQVSALAINANGESSRFSAYDLPVIADSIDGFAGPLAGVLAGLDWAAKQGCSHIVTAAADTPFFPLDLVQRLQDAAQETGAGLALAATKEAGRGLSRHPTFGLWPVALREDLRTALNDGLRKVVAWTDAHDGASAQFENAARDPFFNVNTPGDLTRAQDILAGKD